MLLAKRNTKNSYSNGEAYMLKTYFQCFENSSVAATKYYAMQYPNRTRSFSTQSISSDKQLLTYVKSVKYGVSLLFIELAEQGTGIMQAMSWRIWKMNLLL